MNFKLYISLLLLLFFSMALHAQDLSTKSRKAKKYYEEASSHLMYGQYYEANEKLQKAINTIKFMIVLMASSFSFRGVSL